MGYCLVNVNLSRGVWDLQAVGEPAVPPSMSWDDALALNSWTAGLVALVGGAFIDMSLIAE